MPLSKILSTAHPKLKRKLHFIDQACCPSYISFCGAQIVGVTNRTEVLLCPMQKQQGAQGKQQTQGWWALVCLRTAMKGKGNCRAGSMPGGQDRGQMGKTGDHRGS